MPKPKSFPFDRDISVPALISAIGFTISIGDATPAETSKCAAESSDEVPKPELVSIPAWNP